MRTLGPWVRAEETQEGWGLGAEPHPFHQEPLGLAETCPRGDSTRRRVSISDDFRNLRILGTFTAIRMAYFFLLLQHRNDSGFEMKTASRVYVDSMWARPGAPPERAPRLADGVPWPGPAGHRQGPALGRQCAAQRDSHLPPSAHRSLLRLTSQ